MERLIGESPIPLLFPTFPQKRLQSIRLAAGHFAGIAWESSGHRIGALIDTNIYLVVMKLPYRWTYCGQTLVFTYKSADTLQDVSERKPGGSLFPSSH
jgi:hypothetical protein